MRVLVGCECSQTITAAFRACLWLRGLPELPMTNPVKPSASWTAVHKSPRIRSKTFSGLAAAMVEYWGGSELVGYQYTLLH